MYSKTCLKQPLKIVFQDLLSLNEGQNYRRMLKGEHSAILLSFIHLPFVIKILVLSIFEWPLKTGFTVLERVKSESIVLLFSSVIQVLFVEHLLQS